MASDTRYFLMRYGVIGRRPGVQASPRWSQLLTTAPGMGRKRDLPLMGEREAVGRRAWGGQHQCRPDVTHHPSLPRPQPGPILLERTRQPGGQRGAKELRGGRGRNRPHPVGLSAPQDRPPSSLRAS